MIINIHIITLVNIREAVRQDFLKKWDFPPTKVENKNVMFFVCLGDNDYDDIDTDAVSDHGRNYLRTRTGTKKTTM